VRLVGEVVQLKEGDGLVELGVDVELGLVFLLLGDLFDVVGSLNDDGSALFLVAMLIELK